MYGFIFKYIQCNNFEKNQKFLVVGGLLLNTLTPAQWNTCSLCSIIQPPQEPPRCAACFRFQEYIDSY